MICLHRYSLTILVVTMDIPSWLAFLISLNHLLAEGTLGNSTTMDDNSTTTADGAAGISDRTSNIISTTASEQTNKKMGPVIEITSCSTAADCGLYNVIIMCDASIGYCRPYQVKDIIHSQVKIFMLCSIQ